MDRLFLNAVCFPQKTAMLALMRRCPSLARPQKQGKLLALTYEFYISDLPVLIFTLSISISFYPSYSHMKSSASQDDFKIKVQMSPQQICSAFSYHVWCPFGGSAV